MDIPKQLKIGGHTYKVRITKDENHIGKLAFGNRDCRTMTINLHENVEGTERDATLLHEILHAINTEWDEELVENVAQGLFQVLHDNGLKF